MVWDFQKCTQSLVGKNLTVAYKNLRKKLSDQFNFGALGKAKKIMLKLHSKMDKMDKIKSASSWW